MYTHEVHLVILMNMVILKLRSMFKSFTTGKYGFMIMINTLYAIKENLCVLKSAPSESNCPDVYALLKQTLIIRVPRI